MNFNQVNTEQDAYWLGFIMADGYLYSNKKKGRYQLIIGLAEKDKGHLIKLAQEFKINHCLQYIRQNKSWRLTISNKQIYTNLRRLRDEKIENRAFPEMNNNLKRHFIRGFFDGDGCVHYDTKRGTHISIWTPEKKLLQQMQRCLIKGVNLHSNSLHKSKTKNCYYIQYSGNWQGCRILNYLYKDSNVYLDRKFELAQKIIKKYYDIAFKNNPYSGKRYNKKDSEKVVNLFKQNNNVKQTATQLKISRNSIYRMLQKVGLKDTNL